MPQEAIAPSAVWEAFRVNFWDKPLKDLEHEEPVDEDPDPNPDFYSPEKRRVSTISGTLLEKWNLEIPAGKFHVRSEYNEAEREAVQESLDVHPFDVFMVAGVLGSVCSLRLLPLTCRNRDLIRKVDIPALAPHPPSRPQAPHCVASCPG